jgi:hypothetical protein
LPFNMTRMGALERVAGRNPQHRVLTHARWLEKRRRAAAPSDAATAADRVSRAGRMV